MRRILLTLAVAMIAGFTPVFAQTEPGKKAAPDTIKLPTPAEIKELQVFPKEFQLVSEDDARQIVLTGILQDGSAQDLTGDVQYEVAEARSCASPAAAACCRSSTVRPRSPPATATSR